MSRGQKLGKYELRRLLGKGGMAEVWEAFQPGVDRLVAIKLMHKHLAHDFDFVERFQREAKAVGRLQHHHIIRVFDFDIENDEYYMVMDYIQGGTLGQYFKQHGALPLIEALRVAAQLADALAYAHQQGMIHRDIKPANVMLMDNSVGFPVLTDFGLARLLRRQPMTITGAMVGTPAYMSPEAISGQKVDQRADIYSLGVLLYEMVVGKTPYRADTPYGMILKQMNEPIPRPHDRGVTIPAEVEVLISTALQKEPNERYQNARAFRDAILATLEGLTGKPNESLITSMSHIYPLRRAAVTTKLPALGSTQASSSLDQVAIDSTSPHRLMASVIGGVLAIALLMTVMVWGLVEEPTQRVESQVAGTEPVLTMPTLPPVQSVLGLPTMTNKSKVVLAPLGSLRFTDRLLDEGILRAANCSLELDRVVLPPAETHYELWLANDESGHLRSFGPLEVNHGRVAFFAQTDENLLTSYDRVLISIEPNQDTDDTISEQIAFEAVLSNDHRAIVQQFLASSERVESKGVLLGADEETRNALQHGALLQEALNSADLQLARHHAEHVVHILAGQNSRVFNDWDSDGLAQNPGNGVGVATYINQALELSQQALTLPELTDTTLVHAQQVLAYNQKSARRTRLALNMALKIFDTYSIEEAQFVSNGLNQTLDELLNGRDEDNNGLIDSTAAEGGILAAYNSGLLMAQLPILAEKYDSTRLGSIYFLNNEVVTAGDIVMRARLPIPPTKSHYQLWLVGEKGVMANLELLEMQGEQIWVAQSTDKNLLTNVKEAFITLEPDNDPALYPSRILFRAAHSDIMLELIEKLMKTNEASGKGFLLGAQEQASIAKEHTGFWYEALEANNFQEAKRHAEHVINILEGAESEHFKDWDGNGQIENPGDGVGVEAYLQQTTEQIQAAIDSNSLSPKQAEGGQRVMTYSQATQVATMRTTDKALQILHSASVAEAKPMIEELSQSLNQLFYGTDEDGNGVIDPIGDEGGISTAIDFTILMAEMQILALESQN